jgi:hypothetical protein
MRISFIVLYPVVRHVNHLVPTTTAKTEIICTVTGLTSEVAWLFYNTETFRKFLCTPETFDFRSTIPTRCQGTNKQETSAARRSFLPAGCDCVCMGTGRSTLQIFTGINTGRSHSVVTYSLTYESRESIYNNMKQARPYFNTSIQNMCYFRVLSKNLTIKIYRPYLLFYISMKLILSF